MHSRTAHPGTAHRYTEHLIAFEHASPSTSTSQDDPNTILWVGGLTDGLLTIEYPRKIAAALPPSWVLAEVLLRSSYDGWATGRLSRDASEISECVKYFKDIRPGKKVVIMGHSTGCQDIMEYLVGPDAQNRTPVNGVILQGSVSDREPWADYLQGENKEKKKAFQEIVDTAKKMIDEGNEEGIMPLKGNMVAEGLGAPMSAYRTYSLLAPGGDDDYFSTDLSDEQLTRTFGKIPKSTSVCFLLGEKDPWVARSADRNTLVQRWTRFVREGGGVVDDEHGGVVPGAHHNLDGDPEEVVQDLVKRVCGFVRGL